MADCPLLGVPAASAETSLPPKPPPQPPLYTPAEYRTLLVLSAVALALLAWRGYEMSPYSARPFEHKREAVVLSPLDLNRANAAELATVPGLGETLAHRIVLDREDHGEFRKVEELNRVKGIGAKTLERARPFLYVGTYTEAAPVEPMAKQQGIGQTKKPPPTTKIDVNRAGAAELQKLPGIGPVMAERIIEERTKRPFANGEELRRVKGIGVKTMDKLRPHVTTEP